MSTKPLKAGGEVDSWCTKCLMILNHRIVAVLAGKPVKAECLTCRSTHMYRATAPGTKSAAAAATKSSTKPPGAPRASKAAAASKAEQAARGREITWQKAIAGKAMSDFKVYKVTAAFGEADLVRHSKFGDGVVLRVIDQHKIEVLFQDDTRTLAQSLT